jgi:hypothetical protein
VKKKIALSLNKSRINTRQELILYFARQAAKILDYALLLDQRGISH